MSWCKSLRNDHLQYSYYVHGYFIPWLNEQREKGLLKKGMKFEVHNIFLGKIPLQFKDLELEYEGEIDIDGKACGIGDTKG